MIDNTNAALRAAYQAGYQQAITDNIQAIAAAKSMDVYPSSQQPVSAPVLAAQTAHPTLPTPAPPTPAAVTPELPMFPAVSPTRRRRGKYMMMMSGIKKDMLPALADSLTKTVLPSPCGELVSQLEAARLIGFGTTVTRLYRVVVMGQVTRYKVRGRIVYRKDELNEFIERNSEWLRKFLTPKP